MLTPGELEHEAKVQRIQKQAHARYLGLARKATGLPCGRSAGAAYWLRCAREARLTFTESRKYVAAYA